MNSTLLDQVTPFAIKAIDAELRLVLEQASQVNFICASPEDCAMAARLEKERKRLTELKAALVAHEAASGGEF